MSISVVVPVYNESENIKIFLDRIIPILKKINVKYEIIFVLDPSKDISSISINTYFPRIVDVIREAGGLTINADLERVKVRRINSLTNGGGYKETNISLLDIIENNNNLQNLRIYDGDYIFVNKGDGTNISSISNRS